MWEIVQGFDEVNDVFVLALSLVNVKEKQLFNVSEFGFFLDEVLEGELVLLQAYIDEVNRF